MIQVLVEKLVTLVKAEDQVMLVYLVLLAHPAFQVHQDLLVLYLICLYTTNNWLYRRLVKIKGQQVEVTLQMHFNIYKLK